MANNFRFINEKCPVCNENFKQDEDIVVCPECGTPHHRECYKENTKCANHEKHGEDFQWEATFVAPDEPVINPDDEIKLPFGQTINVSELPEGFPVSSLTMNPLAFFPKELDDGVETEDVAVFVRHEAPRYIKKFQKIKEGKLTWNWGAFFFAPYWFFYRKLNKLGAIFLAIFILLTSLSFLPPAVRFSTAVYEMEAQVEELSETIETEDEYSSAVLQLSETMQKTYSENKTGVIILMTQSILNLALSIFISLNADKWYYKHTIAKVKEISTEPDKEKRTEKLFTTGGVAYGPAFLAVLLEKAVFYGLEMLIIRFM